MHFLLLLDVALLLTAAFLLRRLLKRKPLAPYPPGPKGYPLIGNALGMPTTFPWETFTQWKYEFGDITHVNILGHPTVIINSPKLANEMLQKKSNIYSDRPVLPMGTELVGWKYMLPLTPYSDDRFRETRRYMHRLMGTTTIVANHHHVMLSETKQFLRRLLHSNEDIGVEIRRTAGAIILNLTYGKRTQKDLDTIVPIVEKALETLTVSTTPGAWLVDFIPVLRFLPEWFPGATFKKTAREMRDLVFKTADVPYELVKEQNRQNAELPPSFISDCLEGHSNLDEYTEFRIKWAAASIYAGGADTTVSALHSFILAMVLYPSVHKRAQAEIDLIVGDARLPSFEDQAQLPFVNAIVKEVFRWKPVAPLGLPHRVMEDDVHNGYFIPKGSTVFANIWGMLQDPKVYPDPSTFDPTRHLNETDDGQPQAPAPDPTDVCFGFGRRVCPGMHFAVTSLYISIAMILAVYDISKAVDPESGEVIEPVVEYISGTVSHPKPFKYSIKPRSEKAERLIVLNLDSEC